MNAELRRQVSDDLLEAQLKLERVKNIYLVTIDDPDVLDQSETENQMRKLFKELGEQLETIKKKL
jgi:hypothetical protein